MLSLSQTVCHIPGTLNELTLVSDYKRLPHVQISAMRCREREGECDNFIFNGNAIDEKSSVKKGVNREESMAIFLERCEAERENVTGDG